MAFAWIMTMGPVEYTVSKAVGVAGIVLALACSTEQVLRGIQPIPRGLSGLGCMVAALAPWKGRAMSVLARFGRYSYGVYLSHVLVGEIVRAVAAHSHLPVSAGLDLVIFVFSFAGSLAIVMALGKSPRLAWLNG
jgi:peptidoglycan/LPS O-acetylase OafA/YrhL